MVILSSEIYLGYNENTILNRDEVMDLRKEASDWLASSDYDFETAKMMLDAGRYSYTVFMCHQTVEKLLKALIIHIKKELPAKTHNLRELMSALQIDAPADIETVILKLNPHYMVSRYPDAAGGPSHLMYNEKIATEFMVLTKEVIKWLKQQVH